MKIKQIIWTEVREPNKECSYTHTIGETPFGRFIMTWKGWKEDFIPSMDETPWGEFAIPDGNNVDECRQWAQREFEKRMMEMINQDD
jgi:hypothetical protein